MSPEASAGRGAPDTPRGPARDPRRSADRRRALALVAAALAGAGCCAGAAALTWWTARYADSLVGELTTSAKGSELLPELVPVALLALAGVGATMATRGWPRRLIGGLVVAGGLLVAVRAVLAMTGAPEVLRTALTRPATRVGLPELHAAGPVIAVVGGLLIAVGGVLVVAGAGRAKGMGTRYDAPARRASRARATADDPGALWQALDAGADPTAQDAGTDPVIDTHPGRIP